MARAGGAGWTGAAVGEAHGGQGLGTVELSLVSEGLGRALAPASFFGNAAAALLVESAGSDEQKRQWLPGFASGESRGAVGALQPDGSALAFDVDGAAAVVLVGEGRAAIASAADCTVEPVEGVDLTRRLSRVTRQ